MKKTPFNAERVAIGIFIFTLYSGMIALALAVFVRPLLERDATTPNTPSSAPSVGVGDPSFELRWHATAQREQADLSESRVDLEPSLVGGQSEARALALFDDSQSPFFFFDPETDPKANLPTAEAYAQMLFRKPGANLSWEQAVTLAGVRLRHEENWQTLRRYCELGALKVYLMSYPEREAIRRAKGESRTLEGDLIPSWQFISTLKNVDSATFWLAVEEATSGADADYVDTGEIDGRISHFEESMYDALRGITLEAGTLRDRLTANIPVLKE